MENRIELKLWIVLIIVLLAFSCASAFGQLDITKRNITATVSVKAGTQLVIDNDTVFAIQSDTTGMYAVNGKYFLCTVKTLQDYVAAHSGGSTPSDSLFDAIRVGIGGDTINLKSTGITMSNSGQIILSTTYNDTKISGDGFNASLGLWGGYKAYIPTGHYNSYLTPIGIYCYYDNFMRGIWNWSGYSNEFSIFGKTHYSSLRQDSLQFNYIETGDTLFTIKRGLLKADSLDASFKSISIGGNPLTPFTIFASHGLYMDEDTVKKANSYLNSDLDDYTELGQLTDGYHTYSSIDFDPSLKPMINFNLFRNDTNYSSTYDERGFVYGSDLSSKNINNKRWAPDVEAVQRIASATVDSLDLAETVSRTIYVATTGDDVTGTGLVGAPFAGIVRAINDVKPVIKDAIVITISVAAGSYTIVPADYETALRKKIFIGTGGIVVLGAFVSDYTGLTITASATPYIYNVTGTTFTANVLEGGYFISNGTFYNPIATNGTTTINANVGITSYTSVHHLGVTFTVPGSTDFATVYNSNNLNYNIEFKRIKWSSSGSFNFYSNLVTRTKFTECSFLGTQCYTAPNLGNFSFVRCYFGLSTSGLYIEGFNNINFANVIIAKIGARGGEGIFYNNQQLFTTNFSQLFQKMYLHNWIYGICFGNGNFSAKKSIDIVIDATNTFAIRDNTCVTFNESTSKLYVLNCTNLFAQTASTGGIPQYNYQFYLASLTGTYTNIFGYTSLGLCNLSKNIHIELPSVPTSGTATLVSGTATISTAAVQAGTVIQLSCLTPGGTQGFLSIGTITAGTSFVINSSDAGDNSIVSWQIIK